MVAAQKHWARDLSAEERKVIEKLLGGPLSDEAGVEIRTVAPAEVPAEDADQRRKLDELRRARLAIAEHTSHLTESDLDEILGDRPLLAETSAHRR